MKSSGKRTGNPCPRRYDMRIYMSSDAEGFHHAPQGMHLLRQRLGGGG